MKHLIITISLIFGIFYAANSADNIINKDKTKKIVMEVGFHCAGGKAAIEKKLGKTEGIVSYSVDLQNKLVTVEYNPKETDRDKICGVILELGYSVDGKNPEKTHSCVKH